jgi:threonine synthase
MLGYISTRGKAPRLGFADTALAGLARDGGLYVPEVWPHLPNEDLSALSYIKTAQKVMLPFVQDDIPEADLHAILARAYQGFAGGDVAPLRALSDDFYILELFHGPTLAFKDVALQFLGQVFDYLLQKKSHRATIVGATSGDTGSAAIAAFAGKTNADIFILHPQGRVSEVQRRQMTTVQAPNVFNIAIEGSFDDCQDLVKAMFNDLTFREDMQLAAINSINWARILAQIVYYVHAGAQIKARTGKAPVFCVPTGNFGNVYAGYAAAAIGADVEQLLIAVNRNDILHRFFSTGRMEAEEVSPTLSPSMDIQVSSNFERLLFDLFERQGARVAQTMHGFRAGGLFTIDTPVLAGTRRLFASGRVNDTETLSIIQRTYAQYKYILDPHTAVGVGVAEDYRTKHPGSILVSLATAHPAKFPAAVKQAIGLEPPLPPHLADLYQRKECYDVMPPDLAQVQDFIRQRAGK